MVPANTVADETVMQSHAMTLDSAKKAPAEPTMVRASPILTATPIVAAPVAAAPVVVERHSQTDELEVTTEMPGDSDLLERTFDDSIVSDADTLEPDLNTMILDSRKAFPRPVDSTELDYNLNVLDLDVTAQHVEMPSNLSDRAVVSERRTSIADVLKNAIERDPTRRDLMMKLLETYHGDASLNRRAFLDVARKYARQRDALSADQWKQIIAMGREIAPDDPLFAESAAVGNLADCA